MHRAAKFITAGGGMHAHERWVHCDEDGETFEAGSASDAVSASDKSGNATANSRVRLSLSLKRTGPKKMNNGAQGGRDSKKARGSVDTATGSRRDGEQDRFTLVMTLSGCFGGRAFSREVPRKVAKAYECPFTDSTHTITATYAQLASMTVRTMLHTTYQSAPECADGEQMFMKHHYAAQGRAEECDGHELWVHGDDLALKPCFLEDEKFYTALAKTLLAEKNAYDWVDEDLSPQQNCLSVLDQIREQRGAPRHTCHGRAVRQRSWPQTTGRSTAADSGRVRSIQGKRLRHADTQHPFRRPARHVRRSTAKAQRMCTRAVAKRCRQATSCTQCSTLAAGTGLLAKGTHPRSLLLCSTACVHACPHRPTSGSHSFSFGLKDAICQPTRVRGPHRQHFSWQEETGVGDGGHIREGLRRRRVRRR